MGRARELQTELATRFAERVVRTWRDRSASMDDVSDLKSTTASRTGETANTPTTIPWQGWREIFWRVIQGIQRDRVLLVAAGVAFFGLLALFPAIAATVSVYGLFADTSSINTQLAALSGFMPEGALSVIGDQIKLITQKSGTNWITFASGLLLSIWGANAGTKSIFDALNIIYKEDEKRSFISLNLQSLAFTLGTVVVLCLAVGAVVVLPALMAAVGFSGGLGAKLLVMARWPLLVVVLMFALACLYRFGPSRAKPKWRWVTPGSIAASAIWLIGSLGFSWYLSNFANYNATYGSLGAVIGFFTWLWLSTTIVLLGAEINSESERQTERDTTADAP